MTLSVICGVNWGDEGKGRMVDLLSEDADFVVRYQGGNNAGHTVINEFGTFKLHLIPSGIFRPRVHNVLGQGTVIDLEALVDEINTLKNSGIPMGNLWVSDRATICFPFHRQEDAWEEERLGAGAYGSTKRGISPAYGDRVMKKGVHMGLLRHRDDLAKRIKMLVEWKTRIAAGVYGKEFPFGVDDLMDWCGTNGDQIGDLLVDTTKLLDDASRTGAKILFAAQLGALRDIYFGIYP